MQCKKKYNTDKQCDAHHIILGAEGCYHATMRVQTCISLAFVGCCRKGTAHVANNSCRCPRHYCDPNLTRQTQGLKGHRHRRSHLHVSTLQHCIFQAVLLIGMVCGCAHLLWQRGLCPDLHFQTSLLFQCVPGPTVMPSSTPPPQPSPPHFRYMVSEIQYGGRVTDDKDRVLLATITEVLIAPKILTPDFAFCPGYNIPRSLHCRVPCSPDATRHNQNVTRWWLCATKRHLM